MISRERVRYLLNSIQSSDAPIYSAKTKIMVNAAKKNDFEEAADFIMITAPAPKFNNDRNHRISALGTKKGKIRTCPKTGVELRFFKKHE